MKLDKAVEVGIHELPLAIDIGLDTPRIIAEGFIAPGGFAFADVGWDAPMHAGGQFHFVEGKVSGEGPWKVGDAVIREIEHGDNEADELNQWRDYLLTDHGKHSATRRRARATLRSEGMLS